MKTLVTGASGFVGSAVIRKLHEAGRETRVLLRKNSDRRNINGLPVEIVEGDLKDPESLKQSVQNCKRLFHVAADYRLWIPNPDDMYKVNVEGTVNLIRAAMNAGVEKIVYTSSVAALGLTEDGSPANEETPVSLDDKIGHYKRSKYLAEQEVLKLAKDEEYPITIVNPSTPIGPRDIKPTPTGRIIVDTIHKRMPAFVDTGLNIVHVDDVASGHLLAEEKGTIGERYILGGEDLSLKQILETICQITNLKPPRIRLSHNMVLPIAYMSEFIARITGNEPRATVDGINMARKNMFFSSNKAINQIGYQSGPAKKAIEDAIAWFTANEY